MRLPTAQSGQIGVAVMLMMVIMSTVGFALATRATRDVQTSRQNQDAVQTFAAAESIVEGVLAQTEVALDQAPSGTVTNIENIEGSYQVTPENTQTMELEQGTTIEVPLNPPGQTQTPSFPGGSQVEIDWARSNLCIDNPASLAITVVNTAGPTPVARSEVWSACAGRGDNIPVANVAGSTLSSRVRISLVTGDTVVRITPLYNDTPIRVAGVTGLNLPTQRFRVVGTAKNTNGRETKAVQVERSRAYAPGVLNYALVSGTTLTK